MPAAFSWFLALRYLLSRWVTILSIGGVTVAVWALIVVISVFSGFISGIRDNIRRSSPDLLVSDLPWEQSYAALRPALEEDADVEATAPRLVHYGIYYPLRNPERRQRSQDLDFRVVDSDYVVLLGIDPGRELRTSAFGSWLDDVPEQVRVVDQERPFWIPDALEWVGLVRAGLPHEPERSLHVATLPGMLLGLPRVSRSPFGPRIGDPLSVVSAYFEPGSEGEMVTRTVDKRFALAGAFETDHRLFDEMLAVVPIEALRTILGHDALDETSTDIVTDIAVRVREGADLALVADRLQDRIRPLIESGDEGPQANVLTWEQQNATFLDAVEQERALMKLVLFAVMLVAAFLIYATLNMMVTQKVKDIGILAAMGATPRSIQALFLLCGAVVGVVGCSLGAVAGIVSAIYLNPVNDWMYSSFGVELFPRRLYSLGEVPYQLEAAWILQVVFYAMLLSLLVAWLPARKAARLQPVEALAYE